MTSEEMNIKVLKDIKKSMILCPEPILETKYIQNITFALQNLFCVFFH